MTVEGSPRATADGQPAPAVDRPDLDYAGLFDASPNPYLVLDRRLHIVGANRAYLDATKCRLQDIVGRWAWDAFPTDPKTLRQSVASFERAIRDRRPDTMALLRFDIPRPEAEGGGFEEHYWSIVHAPVLDGTGEVALVLQHPIDVTELKRLRDAAEGRRSDLKPAQRGIFERALAVHEANLSLQAEAEGLRRLFAQAPGFMCVLRGPEHRFELANAAYARLVGGRDLVGRPVREALPELEGQGFFELLDRVYATGEPFVGRGVEVSLRAGQDDAPEPRFLDFVYQPIADEAGNVSGIFVQGNDVTAAKRGEERLRQTEVRQSFLLRLGDTIRPLRDAVEVQAEACRLLGEHLRVAQVGFGEVDAQQEHSTVHRDWNDGRVPSAAGVWRLADFGPAFAAGMRRGETVAVADVARDPRIAGPEVAAAYAGIGTRAFLDVPLVKGGRLVAMLFINHPEPRVWSPAEVELVEEVCERVWDAVERARAEAALRASEERLRALVSASAEVMYSMSPDWGEMRQLSGGGFLADTGSANRAWLEDYIHPDDRPRVTAAIQEAVRTRGVFELEHRVRRADGRLGWTLSRAVPLLGPVGETREWFGVARDMTARRETEEALRASEERLRLIVENARDYAIFTTDPGDVIDTWLPGAANVFGWSAEEAVGRPAAMIFTPEDCAAGVPEVELETARSQGMAPNVRWHLRKDGSRVFIEGSTTALRGADGRIRGFLKIGQDVTARRAAEERQALLAREVDHRAKNALAVVQAALRLTPKEDPEVYARAVEGRVGALARAQTLLAEERWNGAGLHALLRGELAPFLGGTARAELDGPPVVLPAGTAQPLAMAVHELATNAVKHGALSVPGGRVAVSWCLERNAGAAPLLRLRWAEAGGPPVAGSPARRGFGTRVLDGTVRGQLGGKVSLAWEASGLICAMDVPLKPERDPARAVLAGTPLGQHLSATS